jgi:CRP-like cAMP-binding protein
MVNQDELVDRLANLSLFVDLGRPQLEDIAHTFEEAWFPAGAPILRQGLSGSAFYLILEGEASVRVDGVERAKLARGDFFGELSILLGEPPTADVVALAPLRCATLAGPQLEAFLTRHPRVMFRMLQMVAMRLRNANRWRS